MGRQRYGLEPRLANALVTIKACDVARLSVPEGHVSHAASVLFNEGIVVDENISFRPAQREGKHGVEVVAPIGIWLSYEEMEWLVRKTDEAHKQAGSKATMDRPLPNPLMSEEGKSV